MKEDEPTWGGTWTTSDAWIRRRRAWRLLLPAPAASLDHDKLSEGAGWLATITNPHFWWDLHWECHALPIYPSYASGIQSQCFAFELALLQLRQHWSGHGAL